MTQYKNRVIQHFITTEGKDLFQEWFDSLKDKRAKDEVRKRIARIELGNFGDHHPITGGKGISELRITYGPGYRIYYGETETAIILLLCGGDKSSQRKDIKKAKECWQLYLDKVKEQLENNEQTTDKETSEPS